MIESEEGRVRVKVNVADVHAVLFGGWQLLPMSFGPEDLRPRSQSPSKAEPGNAAKE